MSQLTKILIKNNIEVILMELLDKVKADNELNNYLIYFKVSELQRLNI